MPCCGLRCDSSVQVGINVGFIIGYLVRYRLQLWRDVMLSNREELLNQSRMFQRNLQSLELMISSGNGDALLEQIENASATRANWSMAKQQK